MLTFSKIVTAYSTKVNNNGYQRAVIKCYIQFLLSFQRTLKCYKQRISRNIITSIFILQNWSTCVGNRRVYGNMTIKIISWSLTRLMLLFVWAHLTSDQAIRCRGLKSSQFSVYGTRLFPRRHFSYLIAIFNFPLILFKSFPFFSFQHNFFNLKNTVLLNLVQFFKTLFTFSTFSSKCCYKYFILGKN